MSRSIFHHCFVRHAHTHRVPLGRRRSMRPHYCRALHVEPLEDRRLLSITVDTLEDGIDVPGTSLREAIAAAAAGEEIGFSVNGTINLSLGEFAIDKDLTITGPGVNALMINAGGNSRIFNVDDGVAGSTIDVSISGLTLTGGYADVGGAIYNAENLVVSGATIRGNTATNAGGGIAAVFGNLAVDGSTIHDNFALNGAGISNWRSELTVTASTIRNNVNLATGSGGGIHNQWNTTLTDCTISNNASDADGGGIYNFGANLTVTDCTIRDNSARVSCGGVWNQGGDLVLTACTISNNSAGSLGGIGNDQGDLTVTDCTIDNNFAVHGTGGISNYQGNLTVIASTISYNSSDDGGGGGISNFLGNLTVSASTISNNSTGIGGGIYNYQGTLTVTASTISDNVATNGGGGGILSDIDSITTQTQVVNSTISANRSSDVGGGIFNVSGRTVIRFSTITENQAPDGWGSGVASVGHAAASTEVYSSIIADNAASDADYVFGYGFNSFDSAGFNLIGTGNATIGSNNAFNQIGDQVIGMADPGLGPLDDNGGTTFTHALLHSSPALDAGDWAIPGQFGVPGFDQRGAPYSRVVDCDSDNIARLDIGAFECQNFPSTLVVDTDDDELDGNYFAGDLSLREAIALANVFYPAGAVIEFSASLDGQTIYLDEDWGGELLIVSSLEIDATNLSHGLTVDAGHGADHVFGTGDGSRIFNVDNGNSLVDITVSIAGLTLTGGDVGTVESGGAILNREDLAVSGCTISDNFAANDGGGIFTDDGSLTVTACTIVDNSAGDKGGGIRANEGNLSVHASTISQNLAVDDGGGIFTDDGGLTVTHCTIQYNSAGDNGGGIDIDGGNVLVMASTIGSNSASNSGGGIHSENDSDLVRQTLIANTTISGNFAALRGGGIYNIVGLTVIQFSTITENQAPDDAGSGVGSRGNEFTRTVVYSSIIAGNWNVAGDPAGDVDVVPDEGTNSFDSAGYNLIGTGNATAAFGASGDQVIGASKPGLGSLAGNGGPTWTHALMPGSLAIDAGDPGYPVMVDDYDQRGLTRVRDGDGTSGARVDIGAVEAQAVLAPLLGDYNRNGTVDAADYVTWRHTLNTPVMEVYAGADGNGNWRVDADDYDVWRAHFGQVAPVPGAGAGAGISATLAEPVVAAVSVAVVEPAPEDSVALTVRGQETRAQLASAVGAGSRAAHVGESLRDSHFASRRDATTWVVRLRSPDLLATVPRADLLLAWLSPADDDDQADEDPGLVVDRNDAAEPLADVRDRLFDLVGNDEDELLMF